MLYDNSAATLLLADGVENILVAEASAEIGGSFVHEPLDINDGEDTVWDIQLHAPSNAYLTTGDMSEYDGVENGIKFTNMAESGALEFELRVLVVEEATELLIRMDSGWPNASMLPLELPETGQWTSISIPLADLQPNGANEVNFDEVINPFVIQASAGMAHVQLNDIRITCPEEAECSVDPVPSNEALTDNLYIFEDAVDPTWDDGVLFYNSPESGEHSFSVVADSDDADNDVLQIEFGPDGNWNSTMYIRSSTPKDLSAFADGHVVFDIKVVNAGSNTGAFVMKAEGGGENPGADHDLTVATDGAWETKTIAISELGILDMTAVDVPFSLWPAAGTQGGVVFQLDNIRWELAE
ncbi:putative glycoside hydrolase [Marinimicrobium alkaliphilum]|uniref:putative glycoside hydrolase n=1 Tax=Marinimicrobium alkaliphilum TaxID=2202654 RepID=UPI001300AACB|nr:putative glycoside hydrolase [Marinimicrobium alkaliphilum]